MAFQALYIWLRHTLYTVKLSTLDHDEPGLEHGQGLVEYALLLIMVGVIVTGMLIVIGPTLANFFQNVVEQFRELNP
jgi:Flp pilus assembly pilin Flp